MQRKSGPPPGIAPVPVLPVAMPLSTARLSRSAPTPFEIRPDAAALRLLAGLVGVTHLRKVRFAGQLAPLPGGGWELTARLGATVVQPCGATLVPVTTRIDETVERRFLPDYAEPDTAEAELPEDVDAEPLGAAIDPAAVMVEALALAVPPFPRAEGAAPGPMTAAPPGAAPLADADARPMAGLARLRDRPGG